jgi:fermentation-respiration switch protein FrsA (DUF1100 family)
VNRTDVTFDSWGARCAAWLYRPDGEETVPCVVLAHGFAGIREAALDRYGERFAQAGLAALVFDYRHFGASEGEPRQLLDIRRQHEDWAAAIAYARTLDGVDPDRIALWGSSFSGGHVLHAAARDHRIAAVVSQVPFVDGPSTLRNAGPRRMLALTRAGLRDQLGALLRRPPHMLAVVGPPGSVAAMTTPDAEPGYRAIIPAGVEWRDVVAARIALRIASYRPGRLARQISCPLLVCVADDDAIAPAKAAVRAASRATRAEVRHYPAGHFDLYIGEGFERVVADETDFLVRHLLGSHARAEGVALPT